MSWPANRSVITWSRTWRSENGAIEQQREHVVAALAGAPPLRDLVVDQAVEPAARVDLRLPRRARPAQHLQPVLAAVEAASARSNSRAGAMCVGAAVGVEPNSARIAPATRGRAPSCRGRARARRWCQTLCCSIPGCGPKSPTRRPAPSAEPECQVLPFEAHRPNASRR